MKRLRKHTKGSWSPVKTWDEVELVMEGDTEFDFPKMFRIRQECAVSPIENIRVELKDKVAQSKSFSQIKQGQRIAITVGSRGIDQIDTVVRHLVEELKAKEALPFIVPCMGSHGGGTAEGQTDVLTSYGVTEEKMGAPVFSSMEAVEIGQLSSGAPLFCDKYAYESDGIIVLNRVKLHTSFRGDIESGLTKMLAIGMGKHKGATSFHQPGFFGMSERLMESVPIYLKNTPICMGLALLENAQEQLSVIETVEPDEWLDKEKKLLQTSREMMPRIPLDDIDVLVVDEIGKNVSGTGMDPNIINRTASPAFTLAPIPKINKVVVLDLTEESAGNANGIGMADVTTRRLVDKINLSYTYANSIAATVLGGVKIPIPAATDREAITLAIKTSNFQGPLKIVRIKNSLDIHELLVSEGCLPQIDRSEVEVLAEEEWTFNE